MLDDRVRAVVARLGDDPFGRFLFSITAPQTDCEVLKVGGRSTVWIGAGVRTFGGRVLAVDQRPESMQRNVEEAGLGEWALVTDRHVQEIGDIFDVVVLHEPVDAATWALLRERVEPAALVVARAGHPDDPTLEWTTAGEISLGVVLR